MPDTLNKFYLTTPIYYVNARPHIGHAYSTIAADVIARRHRLLGDDTFFLTGTDEHGQKIERSAAAAGVPPQQFADQVSAQFEGLWKRMGITYNQFIRTTDEKHKTGAQKLFRTLYQKGYIKLGRYTGAYCVSDEAFVDLPVGSPCPDCGKPLEEVTEENFFFELSAFQEKLIDLISPGSDGAEPTLKISPDSARNEVLSFLQGKAFDLDRLSKQKDNPELQRVAILTIDQALKTGILKRSANGVLFDANNLKNLSISRSSFAWGIPVPNEVQQAAGAEQKHVIYVWLDALANYITAIGYGAEDRDDLTPEQKQAELAKFARYWPADLHLVGKEITRFHCVYWPAFLMAAGLPLPKSVVANGWLLFEESKMSKSRGNVVRTETILDAFGDEVYGKQFPESTKAERDLFAADVLRYFLLREIPFGQDGSFSFDALITRYNADLANGYGNLVSRTLGLIGQNFTEGIEMPSKPWLCPDRQTYREGNEPTKEFEDRSGTHFIISQMTGFSEMAKDLYWPTYRFQIYLAELVLRIGHVDAYLSFHKPWALAKSQASEDRKKLVEVLYTAAESIRIITALLYPIMPYATASVWSQLGLESIEQAARNGELKGLQWGGLKPGTKLGPLAPIFPRADKGLAQLMTDMENPTPAPEPVAALDPTAPTPESLNAVAPSADAPPAAPGTLAPVPESPTITIDDFVKVDLRVAQIVVAERIPKADKLLRLEVDLGTERRQILSGIAEFYTPEELIGKRIAIIANLAPRKMRGLESHGMLLAASSEDHSSKPILATFSDEIALGSRIR